MRTLCDACESAAAIVFCAADEAALCRACDQKIDLQNQTFCAVPRCDICENTPAFFFREIDGTSLCLQCDMIVHVGGKRTHGRFLLLRQRVEFPGDKPGNIANPTSQPLDPSEARRGQNQAAKLTVGENQQNDKASLVQGIDAGSDGHLEMDTRMIDLNMKPHRIHGQVSNNQVVASPEKLDTRTWQKGAEDISEVHSSLL
ncbi:hypothetical protein V6N11_014925 [Hibiscus sabdariffa]|uniref:B box-type domain-containing protein n=1 Tax=Hibiscus sabdariffa TaxID=183260 RepID=A0ABR2TQI7_9ROSI